LTYE